MLTLGLGLIRIDTNKGPTIGPWVAGNNSLYSANGSRARATSIGVNNSRISKKVSGLTPGRQYTVITQNYNPLGLTVRTRISADANLSNIDYGEQVSEAISITFTAPVSGIVYIGLVVSGITADGQYGETNDTFILN